MQRWRSRSTTLRKLPFYKEKTIVQPTHDVKATSSHKPVHFSNKREKHCYTKKQKVQATCDGSCLCDRTLTWDHSWVVSRSSDTNVSMQVNWTFPHATSNDSSITLVQPSLLSSIMFAR